MTKSCRNCEHRITYRHVAIPGLELHKCDLDNRRVSSLDYLCGVGSGRPQWRTDHGVQEILDVGTDVLISQFSLYEKEILEAVSANDN